MLRLGFGCEGLHFNLCLVASGIHPQTYPLPAGDIRAQQWKWKLAYIHTLDYIKHCVTHKKYAARQQTMAPITTPPMCDE
jgi:hypothetical protein